jgi:hypothetical protein
MGLAQDYAEEHRSYLKNEHPKFLENLRKSGNLASYLEGVGEDAAARPKLFEQFRR